MYEDITKPDMSATITAIIGFVCKYMKPAQIKDQYL